MRSGLVTPQKAAHVLHLSELSKAAKGVFMNEENLPL